MLRNLTEYHRPTDLQEALRLLSRPHIRTVPLGGGSKLVPSGDLSVQAVVDLSRLGLNYIQSDLEGLRIGATTTLQALVDAPEVAALADGVICEAASLTAARNFRNQATLGGTLATAKANAPLAVVLLALDTQVTMWAPGEHKVPLSSFLAYRDRLRGEGGLITEAAVPRSFGTGAGFAAVGRTPRDQPIVCAAGFVALEGAVCREARLALGGVADHPLRLQQAEQRLARRELSQELISAAAEVGAQTLSPPSDFLGSSEYRRDMASVLGRRALMEAWENAKTKPQTQITY